MIHTRVVFSLVVSVLLVTGLVPVNGEKPVRTLRSGTIENDDVAEALSKDSKKYTLFLDTSNAIVKSLQKKAWGDIYKKNFHPEFTKLISPEKFTELNEKIIGDFGSIESYKSMQWYFAFIEEGGKDILISVKIVHHRAAVVYYKFTFYPDNPRGIIGFYYSVKHLRVKVKS